MVEDTNVVEESGWKVGAFVDALCSKTGAWFLGIRRGVYFKEMLFKELGGEYKKLDTKRQVFYPFTLIAQQSYIFSNSVN